MCVQLARLVRDQHRKIFHILDCLGYDYIKAKRKAVKFPKTCVLGWKETANISHFLPSKLSVRAMSIQGEILKTVPNLHLNHQNDPKCLK